MIVKVNNNMAREMEIETAQKIVVDAMKNGEKGISKFTHHKCDSNRMENLDYTKVIRIVEFYTDGSVGCVEKGHSDDAILFKIYGFERDRDFHKITAQGYGSLLGEDFLDGYYDLKFQDICKVENTNEY